MGICNLHTPHREANGRMISIQVFAWDGGGVSKPCINGVLFPGTVVFAVWDGVSKCDKLLTDGHQLEELDSEKCVGERYSKKSGESLYYGLMGINCLAPKTTNPCTEALKFCKNSL